MSNNRNEECERIREERRAYEADVTYGVWRRGGDVDRIDHDRVSECYFRGDDWDAAATVELRHQRAKRQEEADADSY